MRLGILTLALSLVCQFVTAQVNLLEKVETRNHAVIAVAYSPQGNLYATSGYDQTIIIRNTKGEMLKRLKGHNDMVKCLAFSADEKYLLGGGDKKVVYVWDIATGTLSNTLKGHKADILALAVSANGLLASASSDKTIKLWQLADGTLFRTLENHESAVNSVSFNQAGTILVSSCSENTVNVWDAKTGFLISVLRDSDKKGRELLCSAQSPDGKWIAAANTNNKIVIWDASAGYKLREITYKDGPVMVMQYSPDSRFILTGMASETFAIWNAETTTQVFESKAMGDKTYSIAFSPTGDKMLTSHYTNAVYVWDIKSLGIPAYLEALKEKAKPAPKPEAIVAAAPVAAVIAAAPKPVAKADIDINIPEVCAAKVATRYALIIGNEDYNSNQMGLSAEVNVDFAINDAMSFNQYAQKVFCIPAENIILLKNAKAVEMHRAIEKLSLLAELSGGKAELVVYYAGHGFPDEVTKEPYIMPVDVSGTDLRFAVSLKDMYQKLTQNPVQRVTIFLDACFSGGARNQGLLAARGVKMTPKQQDIIGNLIVFSASSAQESSLPYREKEHGMFTYVLLKKLQDTKGKVTYGEMSEYLKLEVGKRSILINDKPQNPEINISPSISEDWKTWEF